MSGDFTRKESWVENEKPERKKQEGDLSFEEVVKWIFADNGVIYRSELVEGNDGILYFKINLNRTFEVFLRKNICSPQKVLYSGVSLVEAIKIYNENRNPKKKVNVS